MKKISKLIPFIFIGLLIFGFYKSSEFKTIAAGVSIFLFGMLSLEKGFKFFSGGLLEKIIAKFTKSLGKSLSFGVISTSIMQSSSLVSVITITFLSAGLISLYQGIGIIFGANIGTTTGAWLVAGFGLKVKISAYAMPFIVIGIVFHFQKSNTYKGMGYILSGLGFLFLGIFYMKEGFESFKDIIQLSEYSVGGIKGLFLFTGFGLIATVIMQSSHATLVLIITALSVGQVTYENALALAIGANIGTTVTAILGSLSANTAGKRLAGAHFIFNITTGLIAIIFITPLIWAVDSISAFLGIASNDYTLKLAVFHTIFNLIGVIVMLPFTSYLVRFLEKVIREKVQKDDVVKTKFLSPGAVEYPEAAIEVLVKESKRLFYKSIKIISHAINIHRKDVLSNKNLDEIIKQSSKPMNVNIEKKYEKNIKPIYSEIIMFAALTQTHTYDEGQIRKLGFIKAANRDIADSVKEMVNLQNNVAKFSNSKNLPLKREYDKIRKNIALTIRTIFELEREEDLDVKIDRLSELKNNIKSADVLFNGKIDELIRKEFVNSKEATSLMNDSAFASEVAHNLIHTAISIFKVEHYRE